MSKYFNDLILPLGDATATFSKVAMADQMGRDMAKEAAKVVKIKQMLEAISKRRKVLKSMQAKGSGFTKKDIIGEQKNIKRLEGILGEARGVNTKMRGKSYKSPASRARTKKQMTHKATKDMHGGSSGYKTKPAKRKSAARRRDLVMAGKPQAAGNPAAEAAAASQGEWWRSKRVWTGVGAGAGATLLGSAALGD